MLLNPIPYTILYVALDDSLLIKVFNMTSSIPNIERLELASRVAKEMTYDKLLELDLVEEKNLSLVHENSGEDLHAIILGIPSHDKEESELINKAIFTYGSHIMDDWFDQHRFFDNDEDNDGIIIKLRENRSDIESIYNILGPKGEFCRWVESHSLHPEGIRKANYRVFYNGLIQQAYRLNDEDSFIELQRQLLDEYMELSLRDIDEEISNKIRDNVSPMTFYATGKTVQEGLYACENNYNPTVAELWNVMSAWFIYYQNIEQEKKEENVRFYDGIGPKEDEMINGIKIFDEYICNYPDERSYGRALQIGVCLKAFDNVLPTGLKGAYAKSLKNYQLCIE